MKNTKMKVTFSISLVAMALMATPEVNAETMGAPDDKGAGKIYEWTGGYAGISLGAQVNDSNVSAHNQYLTADPCKTSASSTSFLPGWQGGYLHQFESRWVVGAEADMTYSQANGSGVCPCTVRIKDTFTVSNQYGGTVRARVGYAVDGYRFLPYITGGVSVASLSMKYNNELGDKTSTSSAQVGWVVGAGLEYGLTQSFSVRAEYLYTGYGSQSMNLTSIGGAIDATGAASSNMQTNEARLGLNYWF